MPKNNEEFFSGFQLTDSILKYIPELMNFSSSPSHQNQFTKYILKNIHEFNYALKMSDYLVSTAIRDLRYLGNSARFYLQESFDIYSGLILNLKKHPCADSERLLLELSDKFQAWHVKLLEELNNQTPEKKENPPYPVYKISESEFHLPCSVCGRVSLILRMGIGSYKDSHSLKYLGITHSRDLDSKHAKKFFKFLSENNIKSAHEYFITKIDEYGFDSFCPACGKIYCSEHYGMKQYIEDGYYDYTEGTCPEGHTRILDD